MCCYIQLVKNQNDIFFLGLTDYREEKDRNHSCCKNKNTDQCYYIFIYITSQYIQMQIS